MKITLTGSLGNISRPLAEILIQGGHKITVISSNAEKTGAIEALAAKPAIGSISDVDFLTEAFGGADAVYTMVPPNWDTDNYRKYIAETGRNYLAAIKASGVKSVVNLSSIGAHLNNGTGPITGLYDVEQTLNTLDDVTVMHLRPGIFYVNFFFDMGIIRSKGIMGNNYDENTQLVMVHPRDIAAAAAHALLNPFEGKKYEYVASDRLEVSEIIKILGASIDKPDLKWVHFSDEQTFAGMSAAGMSAAIAGPYVELGSAIRNGILFKDFDLQRSGINGKIGLRDFATEFAAVYKS